MDTSFGFKGVLLWDGLGEARGADVVIQADGRIVIVGEREFNGNWDLLVMRLLVNGAFDNTFGTLGIAVWDGGNEDQGTDVLVVDNGQIVVSGFTNNGIDNDGLLLGFDTSGKVDSGFADAGAYIWDGGSSDLFHGLSRQPDGMLLAIGGTFRSTNWNLLLMRFHGGSAANGVSPDVTINGQNGPLSLQQTDSFRLSLSVENNGITDNSDWWLVADTPVGILFWTFLGWTTSPAPVYSGPLYNLNQFDSPAIPLNGLPPGTYTFYWAVDQMMDGAISPQSLSVDSATIQLAP
jgi:hypothetical protein